MDDTRAAAEQIRRATERFVRECAAASAAQWSFRPGPAWSIAHVAEHLAISDRNIGRLLTTRLDPVGDRATDVIDDEIPFLFYRGDEPPNVATPTGDWAKPAALSAIEENVRSILDWAARGATDLRAVGTTHPVFGLLDGVQWLLFVAAHTERHRSQVIGLRRHPHFPAV